MTAFGKEGRRDAVDHGLFLAAPSMMRSSSFGDPAAIIVLKAGKQRRLSTATPAGLALNAGHRFRQGGQRRAGVTWGAGSFFGLRVIRFPSVYHTI